MWEWTNAPISVPILTRAVCVLLKLHPQAAGRRVPPGAVVSGTERDFLLLLWDQAGSSFNKDVSRKLASLCISQDTSVEILVFRGRGQSFDRGSPV